MIGITHIKARSAQRMIEMGQKMLSVTGLPPAPIFSHPVLTDETISDEARRALSDLSDLNGAFNCVFSFDGNVVMLSGPSGEFNLPCALYEDLRKGGLITAQGGITAAGAALLDKGA